jgi:methylated-DNA-[protein]-cysteine S-methyltransferase
VYTETSLIPEGRVATYGYIAKRLKSSPRAVGNALRHNPYAPIVPCHRVIKTDRTVGGFYGDFKRGVEKRTMLEEEGVTFDTKDLVNKCHVLCLLCPNYTTGLQSRK